MVTFELLKLRIGGIMKYMKEASIPCNGGKSARDPWVATGEIIPETFPTRASFLKTIGLGIAITVIQFGIFAILIIKPWH